MKLFIDDTPGLTPLELKSISHRVKADHGLSLIVVDYMQLMTDPDAKDRFQEVGAISRGLKALAGELRVPVLAMSQLSRAGDDGRPRGVAREQLGDAEHFGVSATDHRRALGGDFVFGFGELGG